MNYLKIVVFLFFISQNLSSQNTESLEFDRTFYVLGSLSENLGRLQTDKSSEVVDYYYSNEEKLFSKICCLFKSEFSKVELKKIDDYVFVLNSKDLREKMHSFYTWEIDEGITNQNDDVFYVGTINTKLITTTSQKMSFLLGVIERDGKFLNDSIELNLLCSEQKYQLILNLIKEMDSKIISDVFYKDNVPNLHVITFIPNKSLVAFMETSICK